MAEDYRATYLNDHLAGAVAALHLMENIERTFAGTATARFFAGLRADVTSERDELETLMRRLGVERSTPRKTAAWLAERATQLKLRLDDPANGALRLLESVEAIALALEGKLALWRSLAAAAAAAPVLAGPDYPRLMVRSSEQRERVEAVRIEAALAALSDPR
jgi:hypothetical protein